MAVLPGWRIYHGSPIYRLTLLERNERPITDKEALQVGDPVAVHGFGHEFIHMVVKSLGGEHYDGYAEEENGIWGSYLIFGKDDRGCWVSEGLTNFPGFLRREAQRERRR